MKTIHKIVTRDDFETEAREAIQRTNMQLPRLFNAGKLGLCYVSGHYTTFVDFEWYSKPEKLKQVKWEELIFPCR